MANDNSDFNKENILPILTELHSGALVVLELQDTMQQYEELLASTISELMTIGEISPEIQSKIDKNVQFVMNEIDSIMKCQVMMKNVSTKKVDLLTKLSMGTRFSYKLLNCIHVMGPEAFKFEAISTDIHNNIFTIGDKIYQFSTKDDFNNDRSEISEISDINNQYSDDEDELPDLDDDNLPEEYEEIEELKCIEDTAHKYDSIIAKLVYVLTMAYRTANYYCAEGDDAWEVYFSHLVELTAVLASRIKDHTVHEISASIYKLNEAVKSSKADFEINHDNEDCQLFYPFFSAMDYHLDRTQKLLQKIIGAPANSGSDGSVQLYTRLLETEIKKTKSVRASLDLVIMAISYIKNSIEDDVCHFNLFDKELIKQAYMLC